MDVTEVETEEALLMTAAASASEAPINESAIAAGGDGRYVGEEYSKAVSSADLYAFISLMAVFGVTGVVGNSVTLAVFVSRLRRAASGYWRPEQRYGKQYNYFTAALALADLLVCAVVVPYKAAYRSRLVFDDGACKAMQYLSGVSIIFSMLVLIGIAVERYYAACLPTSPFTRHHAWAIIGSIAALAMLGSSPNFITASVTAPDGRLVGCHFTSGTRPGRTYASVLFILFVGTLIVTSVLYGVLFREIYRRTRGGRPSYVAAGGDSDVVVQQPISFDSSSTGTQITEFDADIVRNAETLHQDEIKAVKTKSKPAASTHAPQTLHRSRSNTRVAWMLFGVTFVFLVSWIPYWLTNIRVVPYSLAFKHLYYFNHCTNFIVYAICNKKIRREMIDRLFCR